MGWVLKTLVWGLDFQVKFLCGEIFSQKIHNVYLARYLLLRGLTSGRQPGWLTIYCQPI